MRGWGFFDIEKHHVLSNVSVLCARQVHRAPAPAVLGPVELTSLCYGADALLYSGTNSGQICVWDTETNCCFMTWEADEGEIGGCKCPGYLSGLYQIPWELVREEKQ